MKKIIIFSLIMILNRAMLSAEPQFVGKLEFNPYYHSNITKLSDQDLDLFADNTNPDKFNLESTDDLVIGLEGSIGIKHDYLLKHTQYDRINFKSDLYLYNSKKNNYYLGAEIKQFLSKNFDFSLEYRYYPEIYVARYKSVIEEDADYRDFDYAKNLYSAGVNYRIAKIFSLNYGLDYSQNFYNEYFTEYDCQNISNSLGGSVELFKMLDIALKYGLEYSNADGRAAYPDLAAGSFQAKDASYQENEYKISCGYSVEFAEKKVKFESSFIFQDRFFQSNEIGDTYHLGRHDRRSTVSFSCSYPLLKQLRIKGFYTYENRDCISDYQQVRDDKSYDFYNLGLGLSTSF